VALKPTLIDFFCGAGGFSEGFRQAGFDILAGFDNWQPAIDTYNENFKLAGVNKDISAFWGNDNEIEKLPNTDVIVGSPPCISFSFSNKSGKADKETGLLLIKAFLKIVAVKKHQKNSVLKAWYMENVANSKNFLQNKYTFEELNLEFWAKKNKINPTETAIYLNDCRIINSAEFGGFQKRKRFFAGEFINSPGFISSIPSSQSIFRTLDDLKRYLPSPFLKFEKDLNFLDPNYNIKVNITEVSDHFYDTGVRELEWRISKFKKINHPFMGLMSFPERKDSPSRTILANNISLSREAILYKSEVERKGDGEYRTPTIREAAAIMSFPLTYQFIASEANKWRLVGNAVCPCVSRNIAYATLKKLNTSYRNKLILKKRISLHPEYNLNTFEVKRFEKTKVDFSLKNFKQHIFKNGNMTVSLSNNDLSTTPRKLPRWLTIVQYGKYKNIDIRKISRQQTDRLEVFIKNNCGEGNKFLTEFENKIIRNKKKNNKLQSFQTFNPMNVLENVEKIISKYDKTKNELIKAKGLTFIPRKEIPKNQLFAIYAVSRVASVINERL